MVHTEMPQGHWPEVDLHALLAPYANTMQHVHGSRSHPTLCAVGNSGAHVPQVTKKAVQNGRLK
jgi:hypothetical protein